MILNYFLSLWLLVAGVFQIERTPEFKGGQKSLFSFITRSLIYPEYSKQNCLQGTVNVSFKLNRKGRIFQSKVEKGFGTDLDDEALRIVRLTSGKWIVPADFDTTQALTLPINFSLKEYNCADKSSEDLREAVAAFKAREDLTHAITNFYQKKYAGTYDKIAEGPIIELKQQLGYNERYADRIIRQAQQKLKQGDSESACEDLNFVRNLGFDKADKLLMERCR